MAKKIDLSIVILNYNAQAVLFACLDSLPVHPDWEIIVADNGSTDNSLTKLRADYPRVKVLENHRNLGFAAGNNRAISTSQGDYILLLNPDTVVEGDAIETVLDFVKTHPQVGAATCRVELTNGTLDYSSHRGFPDPVNSLLHFLGLRRLSSYTATHIPATPHPIDALTGAFALIRRPAGDQVGWLDEDYFWNGEDLDFCYKLRQAGWTVYFLPAKKIIHYKGYASKATPVRKRAWAKNSTDVMWLFYRKHLARKYPAFVTPLVSVGIKLLYLYRYLKAGI